MKTMDKVYVPYNKELHPRCWDTFWVVLATHTRTSGGETRTNVWLYCADHPAEYIVLDEKYLQRAS